MQAGIISLHVIEVLIKYQVLRSQYRLTAHIVRIHAFPAAWDGTAMEDYHQAVFVGISQNIFIQAHHLLLVTAEEVYLQALHTALLQPFHLFLAGYRIAHALLGILRCIVPVTVGVVPHKHIHVLLMCILEQLFHAVTSDVLFPASVNQRIFITHFTGQVNETNLVIVVDTRVLPHNPAPCRTAELVFLRRLIQRFHHIKRNGSLHNRLQSAAHRNRTPGSDTRQSQSRSRGTQTVHLARIRESNTVKTIFSSITQVGSTIQAAHTGLRYQRPVVAYMEQCRESIAFTVLGRSSHRFIGHIFLFVARFGTHPANHRVTLRRKERGSGRRKIKASRFLFNHHTGRFAILRHLIAKSYVVITQLEHDVQFLLVGIFKGYSQLVGRIIYRRTLDTVLRVRLFHLVCLLADKAHLTAKVADIRYKAKRRILQHGLSIVGHRIDRLTILQLKVEFQTRIRAGDCCLLGKCLRGQ